MIHDSIPKTPEAFTLHRVRRFHGLGSVFLYYES